MPTVLITGANRGIGREFARQYRAAGWRVVATCRDPARSDLDGEVHALDVADREEITRLRDTLGGDAIDVLINNAGDAGRAGDELGAIDYEAWSEALKVNLMGPVRMAEVFADAVGRSEQKKMVFISSIMGSIDENSGGGRYIYRSSKAALNMAAVSLSVDLSRQGIICLLFHPGWVRTDMGGRSAPVDVETSVAGMRTVIDRASAADSGVFFNYDGRRLPW